VLWTRLTRPDGSPLGDDDVTVAWELAADEAFTTVVASGEVIALGRNAREARQDPTAHAEILALQAAASSRRSWRYVTTQGVVALCAAGARWPSASPALSRAGLVKSGLATATTCKYTKRRSRCAGRQRPGRPGGSARLPAPTRSARVFGLARRARVRSGDSLAPACSCPSMT